jgi:hypothetical protein
MVEMPPHAATIPFDFNARQWDSPAAMLETEVRTVLKTDVIKRF